MRMILAATNKDSMFALMYLLSREPGIEIICQVLDWPSAVPIMAMTTDADIMLFEMDRSPFDDDGDQKVFEDLCQTIPVIALSTQAELRSAVMAAGAEGFIYKGDSPGRLLSLLRGLSMKFDTAARDAGSEDDENQISISS